MKISKFNWTFGIWLVAMIYRFMGIFLFTAVSLSPFAVYACAPFSGFLFWTKLFKFNLNHKRSTNILILNISGEKGKNGTKGDVGRDGPKGPHGRRGEQGPRGPNGEKGEKGFPGDTGDRGHKGVSGTDGKNFWSSEMYMYLVTKAISTQTSEIFSSRLLVLIGFSIEQKKIVGNFRVVVIKRNKNRSVKICNHGQWLTDN